MAKVITNHCHNPLKVVTTISGHMVWLLPNIVKYLINLKQIIIKSKTKIELNLILN